MSIAERFWSKVDKSTSGGCWLWMRALDRDGYGRFTDGALAHRVSYGLVVGPIPHGLQIDHLCRVRRCVNPSHMELVTPAENTRRAVRPVGSACRKGHQMTAENTYVYAGRPRERQCRTCNRSAVAAYKKRRQSNP